MAGYKIKSHKGINKRFKITGKGKVKAKRSGSTHLNSVSNGSQKRARRKEFVVSSADIKRIEQRVRKPLIGG